MDRDARPLRKHRTARVIAVAVVWLVVGAVVNVAVAWGLAAWLAPEGWDLTWVSSRSAGGNGMKFTSATCYKTIGAARATWQEEYLNTGAYLTVVSFAVRSPRGQQYVRSIDELPWMSWGRTRAKLDDVDSHGSFGCDHATGLPVRSLWYGVNFSTAGVPYVEGGLRLPDRAPGPLGPVLCDVRALPYRPLWPGFAINTVFYAAVAWGLWRILILIRCHRRRGRGLCLRCAYDRAGLAPGATCPECGEAAELGKAQRQTASLKAG